ncbi:DUF6285 domain-containing protein [Dongia soli]|uniref:DUF6285 domain-containing protein n=1 Tax=Dongia soli TaxID=600628 RepID=A0ABU5EHG1_9PROT|nr:DUF6285 domain-containing protein [Dongia soli]MDY0885671.1 DUF6285 domain-containing protein [Dongia soli]
MLTRPDTDALLSIALETLQEELLPRLTGDDKLTGLMIARALAIVQAASHDHGEQSKRETAEIAALLDEPPCDDPVTARRQLAQAIRARKFAPGTPDAVRLRDHLLGVTAARLRLVNLKYMAARQRRAESSI